MEGERAWREREGVSCGGPSSLLSFLYSLFPFLVFFALILKFEVEEWLVEGSFVIGCIGRKNGEWVIECKGKDGMVI